MSAPPVPPAGDHGGDGAAVAMALGLDPADVLDLSASLNPFAPDPVPVVARSASAVGRYPDAGAASAALAAAIGVEPERLVLTNGGAEAIALVAAELARGAIVEPEFSLYRRHLTVDPAAPRWRSNPSNPLGRLAGPDEDAGVWDEAFYPLATGAWTRGDEDAWRLGSLTKLWACPGLRLGYVIAPDAAAADRVRERQPRWAVNGLAIAAVPELLARTDLTSWAAAIRDLRNDLAGGLVALGLAIVDTDVNWLLVDGTGLRERLAPHGIVVRDCTSFGLAGTVRVALPPPGELDRVLAAFAAAATCPP